MVNLKCKLIKSGRYCRREFQQSFCKAQCFYQDIDVVSKNTVPMTSIVLQSVALTKTSHFLPLPVELSELPVFPTHPGVFILWNKFCTFYSSFCRVIIKSSHPVVIWPPAWQPYLGFYLTRQKKDWCCIKTSKKRKRCCKLIQHRKLEEKKKF